MTPTRPSTFLPLDGGPWRLRVGTRRIDVADWLWGVGPGAADELFERARLVETYGEDVAIALPGAAVDAAANETLATVAAHVGVTTPSTGGSGTAAMRALATLVADDMCVLDADGVVVAGVVCFPNRWRLRDKLGHRLVEVHAPVPGYGDVLASPVDKLIAALRPGVVLERANWAVLQDPALFQPDSTPPRPVHPDGAGDLWARLERQTLRRLPETGCVVFTIHTSQRQLRDLDTTDVANLVEVLETIPENSAGYKGLGELRRPALAFLHSVLCRPTRAGPG